MECAKLKEWIFFGIGETNSQGWTYMVATQVIYTPFVLYFMEKLKKGSLILGTWQ